MSYTVQDVFRFTGYDGFQNLQLFRESVPLPSTGEVIVKVRSVALNYRDVPIANSTYPVPMTANIIPSCDMAGEVIAIGPSTELFRPITLNIGDAVVAPVGASWLYGTTDERTGGPNYTSSAGKQGGMLREFLTIPAHSLVKLPPCNGPRDFVRWPTTPYTVSTVWNAVYGPVPLSRGDTIMILGTSGMSTTAPILVKATGAAVIIEFSRDEKLDLIQTLPALIMGSATRQH